MVDSFEGPSTMAMLEKTARTSLPRMLAQRGVPTYVHTVNDSRETLEFMQTYKFAEINTDFLCHQCDALGIFLAPGAVLVGRKNGVF